jgi:hypothetical protein
VKKKVIKSVVSLILRFSVILTIFLTFSNLDFALAEVSLTVSCIMPVIAGINTPMIEQESVRPQTSETTTQQQMNAVQNEIKTQTPSMLQADKEGIMQGSQTAVPIVIKTLYSR